MSVSETAIFAAAANFYAPMSSKLKRLTFVTTFAIAEVARTECPFIVVACGTTRRACRSKMHRRQRCRDLSAPGCPGTNGMTRGTIQFLAVFLMAEIHRKCLSRFRRSHQAAQLVTSTTRTDVLASYLGVRSVTLETRVMSRTARRY